MCVWGASVGHVWFVWTRTEWEERLRSEEEAKPWELGRTTIVQADGDIHTYGECFVVARPVAGPTFMLSVP